MEFLMLLFLGASLFVGVSVYNGIVNRKNAVQRALLMAN